MSTFNTDGVKLNTVGISDVREQIGSALDEAFTDATGLTANGLKARVREMQWVLRNKMKVIKASGNTIIYKDDNVTTGFSVAADLTSDATSVVRKRIV
jgi:hypothetical protein